MSAFHMAFRVDEIESTRRFYGDLLQCRQGRESVRWIDFDFFGNQISAHLGPRPERVLETMVDDTSVPLNHFGAVIGWPDWERLHQRLKVAGVPFILEPQVRFVGMPGEQATFFVSDPSGNALEFKAYRQEDAVYQR